MKGTKYMAILLTLLVCSAGNAFAQSRNKLVIADDRLVLTINLKSAIEQVDSILKVAGIIVNPSVIKKGDFDAINKDGWQLVSKQDDIAQFERLLSDVNFNPQDKPFEITSYIPSLSGKPGYPDRVDFGINKYAKLTVIELASGLTRFILPGYERNRRVMLSGSFNDWSTLKAPMKKVEGGWMLDEKLEAGVHEYKYIVDGRWMTDPNNMQNINDGAGNINSVYFKYNYTFRLVGHTTAKKVVLAGDFNEWNPSDLVMEKKGDGWQRRVYLGDGRHEYRFMVDGKWIADLANPLKISEAERNKSTDKFAYLNAVLKIGEPVLFKLEGHMNAKSVVLAGEFPGISAAELRMEKKNNAWVLPLVLSAGNYDYRFVVDGTPIRDPANPYYSVKNNEEWSFKAVNPNCTFRLKRYDRARKVVLCGVFNDWEPNGYTMLHTDGEWSIPFHLKKGKYLYKFRVDGDWMKDPGNKFWESDGHGNQNSVLWIE